MIYLDNAATSGKKPKSVIGAMNYALNNLSANPGRGGHRLSVDASVAVYRVREKLSDFLGGGGAQNVMFCANCTTALNYVIKGVLSENDHVIISDLEHNAVLRPLHKTVKEYSKAKVSFFDDKETVKNFEKLIRPNTKMIICTSASNVTGKILPLKEIGRLCKKKEILFTVDCAQGVGVIPIDMADMGIDYLCVACHKGLFAPMGIGALIAKRPIGKTLIEGGNGTDSLNEIQLPIFPEGFESGTVSVPNIIGVGAGVDFVNRMGIEKIYNHEMELLSFCYDKLRENDNTILYTPNPKIYGFVPVLSFNVKNKNSEEVADYLNTNNIAVRGGFHCSMCAHNRLGTTDTGTVRISPSIFNSEKEIVYFLNAIKKI